MLLLFSTRSKGPKVSTEEYGNLALSMAKVISISSGYWSHKLVNMNSYLPHFSFILQPEIEQVHFYLWLCMKMLFVREISRNVA